MGRNLQALIDSKAIIHNLKQVKKLSPKSKIMAMVKANAYGHGMVEVSKVLSGQSISNNYNVNNHVNICNNSLVDAFGVACIEEGILLRKSGINLPIILIEGFFEESELEDICCYDLEIVLHNSWQVEVFVKSKYKDKITVWFKLNTGKNRLGFNINFPKVLSSTVYYYNLLSSCPSIKIKGVMTHFACADEVDNNLTAKQLHKFNRFCSEYIDSSICRSVANSASIINHSNTHLDWVRPGLMLYGISPIAGVNSKDLNLKPVMTFQARLISIQRVLKGEGIGYNYKYIASEDMLIGIIAVGYADGYKSTFSNNIPVLINNTKTNIVGRVSMDMTAIDLSNIKNPNIGDLVTLWGNGLPIEEISLKSKIIPYELVTCLGARVVRNTY